MRAQPLYEALIAYPPEPDPLLYQWLLQVDEIVQHAEAPMAPDGTHVEWFALARAADRLSKVASSRAMDLHQDWLERTGGIPTRPEAE